MTDHEFDCLYIYTRYRNGASILEIAHELRRTERTIRRRLATARRLLAS